MKNTKRKTDRNFLITKNDLSKMEKAIKANIRLDFEDFRKEIEDKLDRLPTKDEFYKMMDKVMGELQTIIGHQLSGYGERTAALEQKVGITAA